MYDVFICHASEDKEAFVRPLAELLRQQHIEVWYDEFSLSVGDSLTQKIDEGLAKCRFGIVVLSPHFFQKSWTKRELSGLTSREMAEKQDLILPIFHRISSKEVIQHSPPLADKLALSSESGINVVVRDLVKKIKPEGSPLIVARDFMIQQNVSPPPISHEWWLDVVEYKEFLMFPDTNMGKRWIFPLPFQQEKTPYERGMNIASTALQMDWSFEGEELNISPLTPPDQVHQYLRRWPGLMECARENAGVLALYVPQLTIPGFDTGFEDVFDRLLQPDNKEADQISSYGCHETSDNEAPLCGDVIGLRHPKFGNYTPAELAHWYFAASNMQYIRSHHSVFDGLVWLLSDQSDWLPEKYRQMFLSGLNARDQWARGLQFGSWGNPFLQGLYFNDRNKFSLTTKRKNGLRQLVESSMDELGIKQPADQIIDGLLRLDVIKGYYDYQDWIDSRRTGKKRKTTKKSD